MKSSHLVLPPCLPSEMLEYTLACHEYPTTIIICSTREHFLSTLLKTTTGTPQKDPEYDDLVSNLQPPCSEADQPSPNANRKGSSPSPQRSDGLLVPTLQQLSVSRHISLVFVSSITHLRACISVLSPSGSALTVAPPTKPQQFDKPGTRNPLLVVYGLVSLHRDTNEWSAQGLGRTLADLVEAGQRVRKGIVLVEEAGVAPVDEHERSVKAEYDKAGDGDGDEDVEMTLVQEGIECYAPTTVSASELQGMQGINSSTESIWRERMPVLNGTMRRSLGIATMEVSWAGKLVDLGAVLGRWFAIESEDFWHHEYSSNP